MNSIQSDVSFSKGMIGFFFCYKVSIFVALLFNLKGGLYEDASVVFLCFFFKLIKKVFVFKGNACILLETVLCVFFFSFFLAMDFGWISFLA